MGTSLTATRTENRAVAHQQAVRPIIDETDIPGGVELAVDEYRMLWQSVIELAVKEAMSFQRGGNGQRARSWLLGPGRDRDIVFELAGMDVEYWATRIKKKLIRIAEQWASISLSVDESVVREQLREVGLRDGRGNFSNESVRKMRHEQQEAIRFLQYAHAIQ